MTEDGPSGAPERADAPGARAPVPAKNALLALVLLGVIAALGVAWFSARSRGKLLAKQLYSTAVELTECVDAATGDVATLRDALELSPADSTPLAGCALLAERAQSELRELGSLRFPRDKEGLRELQTIARALAEARFAERADALAAGEAESLESGLGALVKGACRIAIGEGSVDVGTCPPKPRSFTARALPSPRVVLEVPAEFLQKTAFSAEPGADGELRLTFATRERDSETVGFRLGRSRDGGRTFSFLSGRVGRADGVPDLPAVSFVRGEPSIVLITQRDEKLAYKGAWLARVAPGGEQLEPAFEVPTLPEGLEPLRAGTPLWLDETAKKQPVPTLAIGPRDPARVGGALVHLLPDGKLALVATPPGTLIAATATPRPRVLMLESGAGVYPALALYSVPGTGEKWGSPERIALQPGAVIAEPASEAECGVSGEKVFPFVARHADKSLLVAVGDPRMFALPFESPAGVELERTCGTCPPSVLARGEDRLTLVFPVGNRMTPLDVGAPLLVTGTRNGKRSVATCERDVVLLAHLVQGRVWVQVTRGGSWQVGRPVLLAAPNEHGAPVDVRVASTGGRLFVFWRRDPRMSLRVEMLASDDGGLTWN